MARIRPARLRCEYLVDPLGIDARQPRLSWELTPINPATRGERQTAYHILAASTPEMLTANQGDLWDSGRVESDQSIHVVYAGAPLRSTQRVWWKVRVWDRSGRASAWSRPGRWSMGLLERADWRAQWIGARVELAEPDDLAPLPVTMLRTSFDLPARVRRATVFVTALGVYELRINGQRVGDHLLAPEWTDYHARVQYQTYDMTAQLHKGENAIGALLGDGWYAGRLGMSDMVINRLRGVYGRRTYFLMQLDIELAGGGRQTVVTDGSWRATREGPIRTSDILDGEVYDARREMPGWDWPGFDDTRWQTVETLDGCGTALVAQPNEPIRVIEEVKPVALTEPQPGVHVFDLGQNIVGWVRLRLRGRAGTTVTLSHAEMLNDDGTLYTANLRGAPQVDHYTLRGGGVEVFEPRFTYHGFRYVAVTGLLRKPTLASLTGRVFNSSSPEVGTFTCSSPMLSRLWTNILWTQRANLMSVPTDCPQRDERLGWMGDIQAFAQTAIFNMDMAGFFTKWVLDVRDAQADDGRYADFSPNPYGRNERFTGVPAWGDAGTVVPWRAYINYGDTRLLDAHLDSAKRWVEYIRANNPDLIWRNGRGNDYNDWLNGDTIVQEGWPKTGGAVPKEVLATAFFARSTQLVAKMAAVLGRLDDARHYTQLFEAIKAAFNREFVSPDVRITGHTQAGYALALDFDLLPDALRPAAARQMVEDIAAYQHHISTGIQTTHRMMLELTRNGFNDVAYTLANTRTFPSWGYTIDNGATTIWERWDGYVNGRGFQDPGMNSFNHWALGAVGEWLIRVVAGINPDERHPAFKRFTLRPRPGGGLTHAKAEYRSIRGPITCGWRLNDHVLTLDITIPPNTTATVHVAVSDGTQITESGRPVSEAPGVTFLREEDGAAVFEVESGQYRFIAHRQGESS